MLYDELTGIIETHAERLTKNWINEVKQNPLTQSYRHLSNDDLHSRVYEVYRQIGKWLPEDETSFRQTASHFIRLGRTRSSEGVKLSEVIYAVNLSRVELIRYIESQGIINGAMDMYQVLQFYKNISRFYDKAVYFVCAGYESAPMEDREVFKPDGFFDKVVKSFAGWLVKDIKHH